MASLLFRRLAIQAPQFATLTTRSTAMAYRPLIIPLITRSIASRTLKPANIKPMKAFKNPRYKLKSKQCAVKRFIVMGGGRLKRGHSGKRHLNAKKNRKRMSRLKNKVTMTGTWCKKMKSLIL